MFSLHRAAKGLHPAGGSGVSLKSTRAEYTCQIPLDLQCLQSTFHIVGIQKLFVGRDMGIYVYV